MKKELQPVIASLGKVAHRGYHDLTRPENSLSAFKAAIAANIAFECDIHLTKDEKLIVSHDSSLERMCGKKGIIEELTLQEIEEGYHLPDGSKLVQFLDLLKENDNKVPMIIELKVHEGNDKRLAEIVAPILKSLPSHQQYYVISFFPQCLRELRKLDVHLPLGLLISTEAIKANDEALLYEFDFLDVEVHYSLFPRFKKYRKAGGAIMVWTVKSALTSFIGHRRADCLTWEKVDSAKAKQKFNRYIDKHYSPREGA